MGADEPNAGSSRIKGENKHDNDRPHRRHAYACANAQSAGKDTVSMPTSKKLVEIVRIMEQEGYIQRFDVIDGEPRGTLEITLKYGPKKAKTIRGIKRISKPGLRIYAGKDDLPRVLGGLGTAIISTSRGVMTDRDARKQGIGGEVIAYLW